MKTSFKQFISEENLISQLSNLSAKDLRKSSAKLDYGNWVRKDTGEYVNNDTKVRITFYSYTIYKKSGMLRSPGSTKYDVHANIFWDRGSGFGDTIVMNFGTARGESAESDKKIDIAKDKAIKWASSVLGVTLGRYDFKH